MKQQVEGIQNGRKLDEGKDERPRRLLIESQRTRGSGMTFYRLTKTYLVWTLSVTILCKVVNLVQLGR